MQNFNFLHCNNYLNYPTPQWSGIWLKKIKKLYTFFMLLFCLGNARNILKHWSRFWHSHSSSLQCEKRHQEVEINGIECLAKLDVIIDVFPWLIHYFSMSQRLFLLFRYLISDWNLLWEVAKNASNFALGGQRKVLSFYP